MSIACIYFPRLGLQLALQHRAVPLGRPLALLAGHGDAGIVAVTSPEAAARGVLVGMPSLQARRICRDIAFLPDNAGACLDALDRVALILRKRTTGDVALGGRNHLLVTISDDGDVETHGAHLVEIARAWTGFDARLGTGETATQAVAAARDRRRMRDVVSPEGVAAVESLPRYEPLAAEVRIGPGRGGTLATRTALRKLAAGLGAALDARRESFRSARLTLDIAGRPSETRLRPGAAFHHPDEVLPALERALAACDGMDIRGIRLEVGDIGPSVAVTPCAASWAWRPSHEHPDLLRAS